MTCLQLNVQAHRQVQAELEQLQAESRLSSPSPFYLRLITTKVLVLLSREMERVGRAASLLQLSDRSYQVLAYVEDTIGHRQPFDLRLLSQRCSLSPSHISRWFRTELGLSPMSYYQRRRIQLACRLLLQEQDSLSEIAYRLGFADGPHFARRFKSVMGASPRDYRKCYQHPAENLLPIES